MILLRRFPLPFLAAMAVGLAPCGLARAACSWNRNLLAQVAKYSPAPSVATGREALEAATGYVRSHPGADYAIGSGDSMLPLYHDRAVIVTERPPLATLKVGQTVVFMGADGIPVAHVLVRRTADGWVTMGLGNRVPDDGALTDNAYMGVVIKAYQPTSSPILAYATPDRPAGAFYAVDP